MDDHVEGLDPVDRIVAALDALPPRSPGGTTAGRRIVAIAGPPGAGKSTLAEALAQRVGPTAVLVGLDGFHFDDRVLDERGDRPRKGAPHTFDVDGYRALLQRLATEHDATVAAPVFDRELEVSRGSALLVTPAHRVVVTEGNWLLLDEEPWTRLRPLFDLTVMLEVPTDVVRRRILDRWLGFGFDLDEAARRADENDVPNAERVRTRSVAANLVIGDRSAGG